MQNILVRALALIDCELDIVKMELEHPERFVTAGTAPAPLAKWKGSITELLELAVSLYSAGIIIKPAGEPMTYSDAVVFIERVFGMKIPRPYQRKSRLFIRKKDETPFLHRLIAVFKAEVEKFYQ